VVWINGVVTYLSSALTANYGWVLYQASAINAAGQIVGSGGWNGQTRAFLLDERIARPTRPHYGGRVISGQADGPIIVIPPGTGPGPGPGPEGSGAWTELPPHTQDLLTALDIYDAAGGINDAEARGEIQRTALRVATQQIDQMKKTES
jgi:hypothetical protein